MPDEPERLPIPAGPLQEGFMTFEFAVYYLPAPQQDPLAAFDSLLETDYSQFRKVEKVDGSEGGMSVSGRVLAEVQEVYRPPDIESLLRFGHGPSREQAAALQDSSTALILDFGVPKEHLWDGMRAALELSSAVARETDGILWDEETREIYTADAWDAERLSRWTEEVPDISRHTVLHVYKKDEGVRAITLGMRKFGLPDVVVDGFPWSLDRTIGHIINLFTQAMAEGATIEQDSQFDLDLRAIRNALVRNAQLETLKANAAGVAHLSLTEGVWEEGDPENRLIEIRFDRYEGPDVHAKQAKMVETMFGWEDSISYVQHDEELTQASQRAKKKLPSLRTAFNSGLAPGEYVLVKAPFETPDGGNEWMWVEVTSWKGEQIKGVLQNEPFNIPNLHSGQIVEVSQADVFDYIHQHADGTQEGNETATIIEKQNAGRNGDSE